jgi:hypothetical protein
MSMTFLGAFLKFWVYILRFAAYNFGWNFWLNLIENYHRINTKNYNAAMRAGVEI